MISYICLFAEIALKRRYLMLRLHLGAEFALSTDASEAELIEEWKETTECLNSCQFVNREKLHSILVNLLIPYIGSLYIMCNTLLQVKNPIKVK